MAAVQWSKLTLSLIWG